MKSVRKKCDGDPTYYTRLGNDATARDAHSQSGGISSAPDQTETNQASTQLLQKLPPEATLAERFAAIDTRTRRRLSLYVVAFLHSTLMAGVSTYWIITVGTCADSNAVEANRVLASSEAETAVTRGLAPLLEARCLLAFSLAFFLHDFITLMRSLGAQVGYSWGVDSGDSATAVADRIQHGATEQSSKGDGSFESTSEKKEPSLNKLFTAMRNSTEDLCHHLLGAVLTTTCLLTVGPARLGYHILITELSTPLLNIMWFLKKLQYDTHPKFVPLFRFLGKAFTVVFFLTRIIYLPYLTRNGFLYMKDSLAITDPHILACMVALCVLNAFWFYKILRMLKRLPSHPVGASKRKLSEHAITAPTARKNRKIVQSSASLQEKGAPSLESGDIFAVSEAGQPLL